MATTNIVVRGGITTQMPFIITSIINNIVYFLNIQTKIVDKVSVTSYYWEPDLNVISNAGKIPIFNATTTFNNGVPTNQVTFNDNTNSGGLGFIATSPGSATLGYALQPEAINISLITFASWLEPFILLSGTDYSLLTNNNTSAFIPDEKEVLRPCTRIQFIPIFWYYGCSNNSCNNISNTLTVATEWLCNQNPTNEICKDVSPIIKEAWGNINDANNNVFFNYCSSGQTCSDCNGPCSIFYYSCTLNSGQGNFSCKFNETLFVDDYSWWTDPYFIGLIVFISIIIIVIFSLVLYFSTRN
jgi:hypothetical protein